MPYIKANTGPSNDIASAVGYWNDIGKVLGYIPGGPGVDQLKQFESGMHTRLNDWTNHRTEGINPPSEAEKAFLNLPTTNEMWQALNKTRTVSGISHVAGGIADSLGLMMGHAGNSYAVTRNPKLAKWVSYTKPSDSPAPTLAPGPKVVIAPAGPTNAVAPVPAVHAKLPWWKRWEYELFDLLGMHHPDNM